MAVTLEAVARDGRVPGREPRLAGHRRSPVSASRAPGRHAARGDGHRRTQALRGPSPTAASPRIRQVTINQRGEQVMEQETTVFLKRRPVVVANRSARS